MRYEISPGKARKSINFIDNIVYSVQKDLDGNEMELKMSVMLQNGNSEMRLAAGVNDEEDKSPKPCIVWIPGGGYRGCDKNLMTSEMMFLADAGYVVASIYYRSSAEGHFPDQIVDVKTAIRFMRAHAAEYEVDPDRIGVIGRSAGGQLSALAAMNLDGYDTAEWSEYSSEVQACCDLFGPVDFSALIAFSLKDIAENPNARFKRLEDTHEGCVLGGSADDMEERSREFSPVNRISDRMCPMIIMHGDADKLVPVCISEDFYDRIVKAGLEERADLYILKGAGHGTREFFQDSTKEIILSFFNRVLKGEA